MLLSNCTINKVVSNHGVNVLEKKQEKLVLNKSNRNDIIKLLGYPSTESLFDNNELFYIERKHSKKSVIKLGKKTMTTNNVLVLKLDKRGILIEKNFLDIEDLNKISYSKDGVKAIYNDRSALKSFFNSIIRKINDPLNNRRQNQN